MGQKEKLLKRLRSMPVDFTFDEAATLLNYLGYKQHTKGKTSGSRVAFISDANKAIMLHKPHPRKELKKYQVKQLVDFLEAEGLL